MSLLQEMEKHGLADCEFNRELLKKGSESMNREEMIDKLVEHKVTNIKFVNIANLFRYGMTGYEDMSDEELKEQYAFFFEEETTQ